MSTETKVESPEETKPKEKPKPRIKFDIDSKIVKKESVERIMEFDSGEYIKFRLAKGLKSSIINAAGKKAIYFIEQDDGTKIKDFDQVKYVKQIWDKFVLEVDPPELDIAVLDSMEGLLSAQIYAYLNSCYEEIIGDLPKELKKK